MNSLIFIVVAFVLLIGIGWVAGVWGRRPSAEVRLRRLTHGDGAMAERLIAHEQQQAPGISRQEAQARAISRLLRARR